MNEVNRQFLNYKEIMRCYKRENSNAPNVSLNMKEEQKLIDSLSMNPTKDYKAITKHYNGYHEQNVCSSCKYYRMRWIDNVCEKHHCIVSAIGICDKFQRNI